MRPTLNVVSEELIGKVLDEAKRIMAETGMEIRGEGHATTHARPRPQDRRERQARVFPR